MKGNTTIEWGGKLYDAVYEETEDGKTRATVIGVIRSADNEKPYFTILQSGWSGNWKPGKTVLLDEIPIPKQQNKDGL